MTAKQVTLKNIESLGYQTGKSIKGKGIEIYTQEKTLFHDWSFKDKFDDKSIDQCLKAIEKYQGNVRYEIKHREDSSWSGNYVQATKEEVVEKIADLKCLRIIGMPKLIGYLCVSKYCSDKSDQQKLVRDIYQLDGYKVADEFLDSTYDEFTDTFVFSKEYKGTKYNGDYSLMHGSPLVWERKICDVIDARLSNANQRVIDDYWQYDYECDQEYLMTLDPEETISVYHYKGKRFYISEGLKDIEITLSYKEDDCLCEDDYFRILCWKENKKLVEEIKQVLKGSLKSCEMKGYINNELERGDVDDYDEIFNLELIDKFYDEDRYKALFDIDCLVDYDKYDGTFKSERSIVEEAYDLWIKQNIIGKELDDGRFDKLNEIVAERGYVLDETPLPTRNVMQSCIKYKSEEYHFTLGELYHAESVESFVVWVTTKLQTRLLEKIQESVLFEKAKHVFVGLEDSYSSGNCKSGTRAFCDRNHIDTSLVGGLRGDVILQCEISNFTKRAVMAAIARSEHELV